MAFFRTAGKLYRPATTSSSGLIGPYEGDLNVHQVVGFFPYQHDKRKTLLVLAGGFELVSEDASWEIAQKMINALDSPTKALDELANHDKLGVG
jgi:hypothetical protein